MEWLGILLFEIEFVRQSFLSKHISLRHAYARELAKDGIITIVYVRSKKILAPKDYQEK